MLMVSVTVSLTVRVRVWQTELEVCCYIHCGIASTVAQ